MPPLESLCLACGMCCDGALFHHVQLEKGDDARKLKALGLPILVPRGQGTVARFPQPCSALCADRTCRIYADRPAQCRSFECGVFKDVVAGRLEAAAALRLVKRARQDADRILQLLRDLGDTDGTRSLNERFRRTQQRLEKGFASEEEGDAFAELSLAMHHFGLLTHDRFYTKAVDGTPPVP